MILYNHINDGYFDRVSCIKHHVPFDKAFTQLNLGGGSNMQQKYTTTLKIVETILSSHRLSGELVTQIDHIPALSGMCDVKITVEKGHIVFCSIHNSTSYISGEDALKLIYSKGKLDWTLTSFFSGGTEKKDASMVDPHMNPNQAMPNPPIPMPNLRPTSLNSNGNSGMSRQFTPNPQQASFYQKSNGSAPNQFTPNPQQASFYQKNNGSSPNQSPSQAHISSFLNELLSNEQFTGAQTDPYTALPSLPKQAFNIYEITIIKKNPLQQPPPSLIQSWPRWQRQIFLMVDGQRTIQQVIQLVAKNQPERAMQAIGEMLSLGYITII
jgi:hypothetical protein